ncbi:hypothetical protein DVH05_025980 [Phytophthora capsici]|nr:hypothetical protein DVH05_025980 [Phytophthora capsici]
MGAPGYTGSFTQAYTVCHNVLQSHGYAVQKLKTAGVIGDKARISIVLNADYVYPVDPSDAGDVEAASRNLEFGERGEQTVLLQ